MPVKTEVKKPRTLLISTIISITVGILVIGGRFWSIASTTTTVKLEIEYLKKEVTELKDSHLTFKEFDEKLDDVIGRLIRIETNLKMEKEE